MKPPSVFLGLLLLLLLGVLLALSVGKFSLSVPEVVQALLRQGSENAQTVVWNVRLPRILAAIVVGAALAAAGVAYQGMFRNPLVAPDILGAAAGAGFGASLAILLSLPILLIQGLAFVGGMLAVGLVYFMAQAVRRHDPVLVLVLTGVAVGTLFSSGTSLIKVLADPSVQLPSITFWLMGGLNGVTSKELPLLTGLVGLGLIPLILLRWRINLLSLPDEEAASLGVHVGRLRLVLIVAATLMTSAAVAVTGIIGWVGLVVPHAARLLVGPELSRLLPVAMVLGGLFLLVADTLARTAALIEIPLGILTAAVGVPVFLALLMRGGRS
ncbi:FecCD family ABC transporter permease [Meiothermus granaticius]|uniref:Putative ABC transporter permease protein n=1 Tax=Meiothermus granaticius NBRC 107808 TaxID=1227551 RepID=A0A399FBH0_9DEIN|nr:iron ABC transporter permease [Meiothermus granaticius]RIH92619.1 putative ABC transporter permease protein [Meiothermus granaticius NBRC 107808]GEM87963.1 peptide ABC transporter substrate-binding protein [Meiothermus granaticius NBRC 107808]